MIGLQVHSMARREGQGKYSLGKREGQGKYGLGKREGRGKYGLGKREGRGKYLGKREGQGKYGLESEKGKVNTAGESSKSKSNPVQHNLYTARAVDEAYTSRGFPQPECANHATLHNLKLVDTLP
jgi:hypothetical protein